MTPPKHPTVCNICGGKVSYVSNARVYGSRYGSGWCYLCESCGAYVGTHGPRPREALGILADKRMRRLKMECHELFDRTWDTNAERRERYARLAGRLGIPVAECHFGYFDAPMLERALAILKEADHD
ncbi:zinc-finger-containing protein [Adlercreutzia sp.]|uniref:zinc-finger-containing protein n=1 Tax=Adlercreutzia sp. TaxID=1872387 RepID=UPI002E77C9CD|nr:zinc-finger-containing protein [Adlercreutzia sp.]MEE0637761.1 zinc-finger-containing protein [Adlercreutzia sp.]